MPKPTKKRLKVVPNKQNENDPTPEQWRQLFAMMADIRELAPWERMNENMIFGVQEPTSGQACYVSIMGQIGEHYCVAVYLGEATIQKYWEIIEGLEDPLTVMGLPHLQASFEDRYQLTSRDTDLIKQLGLRFRGSHNWPQFRSYRPGFDSWYLERDEADLLINVLSQAIPTLERQREGTLPIMTLGNTAHDIFFRISHLGEDGQRVWEDAYLPFVPPTDEPTLKVTVSLDPQAVATIAQYPRQQKTLLVDFFLMPTPIQEDRRERPKIPYSLLVVEQESTFIVGQKLVTASEERGLFEQQASIFINILSKNKLYPTEIQVQSRNLYAHLEKLCEQLDIELNYYPAIPKLNLIKQELLSFLRR